MRTRRRATIEDLRVAIHSLPRTTRVAMLQGMATNDIIVGAYTDSNGICPMLAAHRNGGRTNLISFAKAWDRFAFSGSRVTKPRPATARELLVLRSHLETSLLEEDTPHADLASAIEAHQNLVTRHEQSEVASQTRHPESGKEARRRDRQADSRCDAPPSQGRTRPGDPDRSHELRSAPGWRWTRLFRRYDEYQWALAQVEAEQRAHGEAEPVAHGQAEPVAHGQAEPVAHEQTEQRPQEEASAVS